jgi:arylsulfatase A-like enzyme
MDGGVGAGRGRQARTALALFATLFAALLAVALLGTGCGKKKLLQPHIVVVVADSLNPDHLDLHGYERLTAPALAEWAREGLVFERATTPGNWTRPAVHALFTGREPAPDRRFGRTEPVPVDEPVLAERLAGVGYETAAVSANPLVSTTLGADRGFDAFMNLGWQAPQQQGRSKDAIASPFVLDRVEYMLSTRQKTGRPVFLYVHLMDPHLPYDPPERLRTWCDPAYDGPVDGSKAGFLPLRARKHVNDLISEADQRQVVALYDGEIARLDEGLLRLRALVAEHLADRPVVTVVTADHGEAFGEGLDGTYAHGHGLGENQLRVPLVIHGVRPNGRVPARVGLIDIAPTLAQLAGTSMGGPVDGRPLVMRDGRLDAPPGRTFIAYRALPGSEAGAGMLAVVSDTLRAERRTDDWRLYDVATNEDLTLVEPGELARLRSAATDWLATGLARVSASPRAEPVTLPPGAAETLDALGLAADEP